jgi:hypothetical protein
VNRGRSTGAAGRSDHGHGKIEEKRAVQERHKAEHLAERSGRCVDGVDLDGMDPKPVGQLPASL